MKKILVISLAMFFLESCGFAFITYQRPFKLERSKETSFPDIKMFTTFKGDLDIVEVNGRDTIWKSVHNLIFFKDGAFIATNLLNPPEFKEHLIDRNYEIYHKFYCSDYTNWGVYKLKADTIFLELHESDNQWGWLSVKRYTAIIKDDNTIYLNPLEVEKNAWTPSLVLPHNGKLYTKTEEIIEYVKKIDPSLAWVND